VIRALYNRVLGHPFVYDHVRPFVVGGVDNGHAWRNLHVGDDDVVVDVGCGTGDALKHLPNCRAYYGFDSDPIAIRRARALASTCVNVHFEDRILQPEDLERIRPTCVMLCGLLHHLADDEAVGLLSMLSKVGTVRRVATVDITYLPGKYLNNFYTRMDRGQFPRLSEGYQDLARRGDFEVERHEIVRSHPTHGRAWYVVLQLAPKHASL
jgi:SAM-dependent methyltransferase